MTTSKHDNTDDNDDEELRREGGGKEVCSVSNTAHLSHFRELFIYPHFTLPFFTVTLI